jgi:hypothetical protein
MLGSGTLADRYELRHQIGAGGMARVYLAWDEVLHRNVAVKVLNEAASGAPAFVARFRREAQSAAALQSPNIVQVYDWGHTPDEKWPIYYLVMEYVAGPNLKEVIQERGSLPEAEALRIAADIAAALEVAHRQGIIHRDIKPQNVLLGPGGTVKVADFGIARATGLTQLTTTQSAVYGSAHYVSPEQAQRGTADQRSDIYSLGVVLYEMLTGRELFSGESLLEVVLQHVNAEPVPPSQVQRGISVGTEAVVLRALAKDPGARFPNASAMRHALLQARNNLARRSPAPKPVGSGAATSNPRPARTRRTVRSEVDPVGPAVRGENRPARRAIPSWLPILAVAFIVLGAGATVLHALSGGAPAKSHHLAASHPTATRAGSRRHAASPTVRPTKVHSGAVTRPSPAPAHSVSVTRPGHSKGHSPSRGSRGSPASGIAAAPTSISTIAATVVPLPTAVPSAVPQPAGPNTIAQAGPPANQSEAPGQAVKDFYADISSHDFVSAAQLWTPSMQSRYPPISNINGRFADTSSIVVKQWSVASITGNRATVDVTLLETLQNGTTQTLVGSWDLVRVRGTWLLDNPRF